MTTCPLFRHFVMATVVGSLLLCAGRSVAVAGEAALDPDPCTVEFTDLGVGFGVIGIDDGLVVGAGAAVGGDTHAFIWTQAGGWRDLGTLGGSYSQANAVSNGQVVGFANRVDGGMYHAFTWTEAGGMVDLGALVEDGLNSWNWSDAWYVSDGQVVGGYDRAFYPHVYSWTEAGGTVDPGTLLGGSYSAATAVSNGQVVGFGDTSDGTQHAFSWTEAGGMVDLGTLGGSESRANAVSGGQVVGWSGTSDGTAHAFSWTETGGMVDLGTLGGSSSAASAISNGQVVGSSETSDGSHHAFVWTEAGGMVDLGTLGGESSSPVAMSGGQVVGHAQSGDGEHHAVLWSLCGVDLVPRTHPPCGRRGVHSAGWRPQPKLRIGEERHPACPKDRQDACRPQEVCAPRQDSRR